MSILMRSSSPYFAALTLVRTLRQQGHEAFLAGGCVRDRLLGRKPKDFDIATSAHPHEVERCFPRTISVGKAFGVIRVRQQEHEIEVATFRSDGDYGDGRRPDSVGFTTAREDAQRRDFTINGIFYDPLNHRVFDFVGGLADLKRKLLRAIGDPAARFHEDHLRMLRAIRFVAQLGFRIESSTWKALCRKSSKIRMISPERIRDELTKLLTAPHGAEGLRLLQRSGLMRQLLPEIEALRGVPQPRAFHPEGDVFLHTLKVMRSLRHPGPHLAWAALLHDIGKPQTFEKSRIRGRFRIRFPNHAKIGAERADSLLRRFMFSNASRETIVAMVANHMTFKDVKAMRLATLKRLLARPTFDEELELHRADCLGSHGSLVNHRFLLRKRRKLSETEIRPTRLVNGNDLIAFGLKPGPNFGRILAMVEDAQLEGRVTNRKQALDFAFKIGKTIPPHASFL